MAAEDDVKQGNAVATEFRESITEALSPRQTLPGFADARIERASGVELPSWFVDRCRRAYLSVAFDAAAECRVLGVTSTAYGEGKTAVGIGIATAMAIDTKKPTLLVECDFAAPSLHKFLGLDQGRGAERVAGRRLASSRCSRRGARAQRVHDSGRHTAERAR